MTIPADIRPWLSTALALVACGSSAALAAVDEGGDRVPLQIVSDLRQPDSTQTPVMIETASISGDTLHLHLSYAGGCGGPHEFGLAVSSSLSESEPPEVTMILHHDGHGDSCRAGPQRDRGSPTPSEHRRGPPDVAGSAIRAMGPHAR